MFSVIDGSLRPTLLTLRSASFSMHINLTAENNITLTGHFIPKRVTKVDICVKIISYDLGEGDCNSFE